MRTVEKDIRPMPLDTRHWSRTYAYASIAANPGLSTPIKLVAGIRKTTEEAVCLSTSAGLSRVLKRSSSCKLGYINWISRDVGAAKCIQLTY